MNVMAAAHKATKAKLAYNAANGVKSAPYHVVFKTKLKQAHKEYKAMQKPNEVAENFKRIIESYKEVIANTSYSSYFLFHTEANILLTENEDKTRLSWGSIHNAVCVEKRIADAYCRKYKGPIKPVHAITHLEEAVKEMEKLVK